MRKITPESEALTVAVRWKEQYRNSTGVTCRGPTEHPNVILRELEALGERATPEIVAAIIGNSSWTQTHCYECGAKNMPVVELGEEPDYESCTTSVCRECLQKALKELDHA